MRRTKPISTIPYLGGIAAIGYSSLDWAGLMPSRHLTCKVPIG